MNWKLTVLGFALVLCGLSACSGSGQTTPPPDVPMITEVKPTGVVGSAGGWVRFRAKATNNPTTWVWDFSQIGASSETSNTPRVLLGAAGTGQVTVRAENTLGTSGSMNLDVEIATAPVTPIWEQMEIGVTGSMLEPALLVTSTAIIVYYTPRDESNAATFFVRARDASESTGWISYSDSLSGRSFPSLGKLRTAELREHMGRVYLRGHARFDREFLACSASPLPGSLDDWSSSETLTPADVTGSGDGICPAVLTFAGDKPVLMGTSILRENQITLASFYTNYVAIANTPLPDSNDDWDVLRLPDLIDGFGTGSAKRVTFGTIAAWDDDAFAAHAVSLPDGGFTYIQTDGSALLDCYYGASEAAVRANAWRLQPIGTGPSQTGVPAGLVTHQDRLILAYSPGGRDEVPDPSRGLGLAMTGDPTGVNAPWTFQQVPQLAPFPHHALLRPLVRSVLDVWGDRLILLVQD